jgi:hypothetical protein
MTSTSEPNELIDRRAPANNAFHLTPTPTEILQRTWGSPKNYEAEPGIVQSAQCTLLVTTWYIGGSLDMVFDHSHSPRWCTAYPDLQSSLSLRMRVSRWEVCKQTSLIKFLIFPTQSNPVYLSSPKPAEAVAQSKIWPPVICPGHSDGRMDGLLDKPSVRHRDWHCGNGCSREGGVSIAPTKHQTSLGRRRDIARRRQCVALNNTTIN